MNDVVDRLRAARHEARAGRFEQARSLASAVLATHPHALLALRLLAWAELELGLDGAVAAFEACQRAAPLDPVAELGLALVARRLDQPPVALRHFCRAFELGAAEPEVRLEIQTLGGELPESRLAEGLGLLREGDYPRAAETLRAAAAAVPDDPAARLGLAHALWRVGAREQVANLCSTLLATHPHCLDALVFAIAAELAMGRILRARELLARVELVDPGHLLAAPLLAETGVSRALQGVRRGGLLSIGRQ